jgi:SAM-dependent methyltransferase
MSHPSNLAPLATLDLVESLFLAQAVTALHESGVLRAFGSGASVRNVALKYRLDARLLAGVLDYIAARTTLVTKAARSRFRVTPDYSRHSEFLLDLYAGAFGKNAACVGALLRRPGTAQAMIDRKRHARAFAGSHPEHTALAGIVRQLGFNAVLDLGCGTGRLLCELGESDTRFVGWGFDANPQMIRCAREQSRQRDLATRLKFVVGDCARPAKSIPASVFERVRAVVASQIMNEFFSDGNTRAVTWLRAVRRALPGRPMLISDYYGRLGHVGTAPARETLLHDFAQLLSGQGIPPASASEWRKIYSAAGCRLVHVFEDQRTTQFVHVVML